MATAVLTATVAIHSTLYAEYEMPPHLQEEKHVFSDLQHWYRSYVDQHVWKLPPRQENDNSTARSGSNKTQQQESDERQQ